MPGKQIGWARVEVLKLPPEAREVAAVLQPTEPMLALGLVPYAEWCRENLGPEGKEWGRVNQFGSQLWFRFHGAVTLFLMHWHRQEQPSLGEAKIRFLPGEPSGVQWVSLDRSKATHELPGASKEPHDPVGSGAGPRPSGKK